MKKLLRLALLLSPLIGWAQTAPITAANTDSPMPLQAPALAIRSVDALDSLRDKLQLTPAQQALWQQYVLRLDTYMQQFYRERPPLPSEDEPAPQQITRLVMNHQNRLSGLEDIEQAAKALYNSLDASQKKTANLLLLGSIPTFAGTGPGPAGPSERRYDSRPGGEMRRRGGGMGGMGSGRF